MTHEERAAFVNAQTALLNCEVAGMVAENQVRESLGQSMAYDGHAFYEVRQQYETMLNQDRLVEFFRD